MGKEFWLFAVKSFLSRPKKGCFFMKNNTNYDNGGRNENVQTKRLSKTKIIAGTGIFTALAYLISFLEIPIFAPTPFLKLDFSSLFILLAGFVFGPISAVCACGVKELLRFASSGTGGVGELANFLAITAFVIVPALVYRYKKGLPTVIVTLVIGCALQVITAILCNRFILFPLFGWGEKFNDLWVYVMLFNIIKSVANGALTVIFYKKVSTLIKRI